MSGAITTALFLALTWATFTMTLATNQGSSSTPHDTQISKGQFTLLVHPTSFALEFVTNGKTTDVPIHRDWLIPPQEEKDEEFNYVSSFHYSKEVSSFPIGNGRVGLHLSSYDLTREGTSHAAAGRDVFLLFDPRSLAVTNGGIQRGVTKWRVRSEGCLSGAAEHYLLADVDGDGLMDIGVIKDEIKCVDKYNQAEDKEWKEPHYTQYPAVWYVFRGNSWQLDPSCSGEIPPIVTQLPLIGMAARDVDDVPLGMWRNFDSSKRLELDGPPPAYIPSDWKNHIQNHGGAATQVTDGPHKRISDLRLVLAPEIHAVSTHGITAHLAERNHWTKSGS